MKLLQAWCHTSLLARILAGFVLGILTGGILWYFDRSGMVNADMIFDALMPVGELLVEMLKMIVIPVIFFSLVTGAASLPMAQFGKIGAAVIGWYLLSSLLAALIGTVIALWVNPGADLQLDYLAGIGESAGTPAPVDNADASLANLLLSMFENPFSALAHGKFLAIIVFAVFFGLGLRALLDELEAKSKDSDQHHALEAVNKLLCGVRDIIFKIVDWILEYTPIGVFALSVINFGRHGPDIAGPYFSIALGVIIAILAMMLVVYPLMLIVLGRANPLKIIRPMQEVVITGFITRSSAATLPVSLRITEEDLKVRNELAAFALPMGATINMDGVCVHLPMFAVLAANLFGLDLGLNELLMLVMTTVLASIGAGGVPGGSLMLLFIILQVMGLQAEEVSLIVALALGINPILDMFETASNVTGDMICTYGVAARTGMLN